MLKKRQTRLAFLCSIPTVIHTHWTKWKTIKWAGRKTSTHKCNTTQLLDGNREQKRNYIVTSALDTTSRWSAVKGKLEHIEQEMRGGLRAAVYSSFRWPHGYLFPQFLIGIILWWPHGCGPKLTVRNEGSNSFSKIDQITRGRAKKKRLQSWDLSLVRVLGQRWNCPGATSPLSPLLCCPLPDTHTQYNCPRTKQSKICAR